MPAKLTTTINKIQSVPNQTNLVIINEFGTDIGMDTTEPANYTGSNKDNLDNFIPGMMDTNTGGTSE
jgi:hypothetical protein